MSHLPRIAKATGAYERVLISTDRHYRSPDFIKYIWNDNPYVDGTTVERGYFANLVDLRDQNIISNILYYSGFECESVRWDQGINILDFLMLDLGMDDGIRYHEPELYSVIPNRPQYQDFVIFDPNYITEAGSLTPNKISSYFEKTNVKIDLQLPPRSHLGWVSVGLPGVKFMDPVANLIEFCSIIKSCKEMFCLTTGTATLAAALGKKVTVLYGEGVDVRFHHSKLHTYLAL